MKLQTAKFTVSSSSKDNMIIYHSNKKFNYISIKSQNLEEVFSRFYSDIISSIDFDNLICDRCYNSSWHYHAYYTRSVVIFSKKIKVKITRIICTVCGKTHAILIEPMIPYLYTLFDDLMNILLYNAFIFESSLCAFLKYKFSSCIKDYVHICKFNARNSSIIIIPT